MFVVYTRKTVIFKKRSIHAVFGFSAKTNVSHFFTLFVKYVGFMRFSDNAMKST